MMEFLAAGIATAFAGIPICTLRGCAFSRIELPRIRLLEAPEPKFIPKKYEPK